MRLSHPAYAVTVRHENRTLEMVGGKDFLLCPLGLAPSLLPDLLPARLEDLVRIAAGVHVADTVCRRSRSGQGAGWSRRVELAVAVSEPSFWNRPPVQSALKGCLDFLGGDDWCLRFVRDSSPRPEVGQAALPFLVGPTVCLVSDGLDSAAGLAARLKESPDERFLAVTVRHRSGLGVHTEQQIQRLRRAFKRHEWNLAHVVIGTLVRQGQPRAAGFDRPERSHRCRSFVFAALGGVVAELTQAGRVEVYESGVGAINLPLRRGMYGSLATKGCHPTFFRLMEQLLGHVVGRRIEYRQPFLGHTKAQMVQALAGDDQLRKVARSTASCVHYPLGRKVGKQCGACPGCIFRRQAMALAGIVEWADTYAHDLFGCEDAASQVPENHRRCLRAFIEQAAWLRQMDRPGEVPQRLREHLIATGLVARGDEAALAEYARPFGEYRREWLKLAAEASERGLWWGELLSPGAVAA